MFRFAPFDCVIAKKDLPPNIKAGDSGTIDSVSRSGDVYLVDFDHDADRIIVVGEEDLRPYDK